MMMSFKMMSFKRALLIGSVFASVAGLSAAAFISFGAVAQAAGPSALTGKVTSQPEGAMEGVLVSAKQVGSTITTTVVTDSQGQYSFPVDRLAPGKYDITMRAAGYMLAPTTVTITGQPVAQDLTLTAASRAQIENQLTSGEWMLSLPGNDDQKAGLTGCFECHTLQRPLFSKLSAADLTPILQRMTAHPPNSSPAHPNFYDDANDTLSRPPTAAQTTLAQYISKVNLSTGPHAFPLQTLPRPKGDDTKVIYTTYDLPRADAHPHDTAMDAQGNVWYSSFDTNYIGKLDPKTGKVTEYPVPIARPESPYGGLQITLDSQGRVYYGNMEQDQIARFDPKTEKFETFRVPSPENKLGTTHLTMIDPLHMGVDGYLWINFTTAGDPAGTWRVNLDQNKWEHITYPAGSPSAQAYQMVSDSHNNMVGHSLTNRNYWVTDAKTLQTTWYLMPQGQVGCRRGHMDNKDVEWCADYNGNGIGMFDMNTKQAKFWAMPTPWTRPYDVEADNKGYVWGGGDVNDLVVRLNPTTGKINQYLVPVSDNNVRHVDVQFSDTALSSLWIEDQHGNTLTRIEPLTP